MSAPKLSERENILHDIKSRECASILGMVIGGLLGFASKQDVREAVRWWAETDEIWDHYCDNLVFETVDTQTLEKKKGEPK